LWRSADAHKKTPPPKNPPKKKPQQTPTIPDFFCKAVRLDQEWSFFPFLPASSSGPTSLWIGSFLSLVLHTSNRFFEEKQQVFPRGRGAYRSFLPEEVFITLGCSRWARPFYVERFGSERSNSSQGSSFFPRSLDGDRDLLLHLLRLRFSESLSDWRAFPGSFHRSSGPFPDLFLLSRSPHTEGEIFLPGIAWLVTLGVSLSPSLVKVVEVFFLQILPLLSLSSPF